MIHIGNVPWQINVGFVCAAAAIAVWRGGPAERGIGGFLAISTLDAHFGTWPALNAWHGLPLDIIGLIACLDCVIHARRYWTIWACAAMALSLATDLIWLAHPGVSLWAYIYAEWIYMYAAAAVLWGALHRRASAVRTPGLRRQVSAR